MDGFELIYSNDINKRRSFDVSLYPIQEKM